MKKQNKVLLKVLIEKKQKKWIETRAKYLGMPQAELVRGVISGSITPMQ